MVKLGWVSSLISAGLLSAALSTASADCGVDHKAAAAVKPGAGTSAQQGTGVDRSTIVVVGAPGHSVEVKAPASQAVSATGGSGAPGKAGAPGKPGQ